MVESVKSWDSELVSIRSVPIICPSCNEKVSVAGEVDGDKIVLSDCPNCGQELALEIKIPGVVTDDPYIDAEFSCNVEWYSNDPQVKLCKWSFGEFDNPADLLIKVVKSGCIAYGAQDYPSHRMLADTVMDLIETAYTTPDALDMLGNFIEALKDARTQGQEVSEGEE